MPGSHSKKDKLKKKIRKARKTVVRDKTNEGYEPTKLKGKKRIPPSRVSPNWAVTKKSYPTSDYQRKVEYEQDKELGEDAVSISESNAKKYSKLKKRIAKKSIRKDEDVFKKIKETGNKMLKEKTERESKRPLIKEVPFGKRRTTIDDRKFESFDRMSAEENARITGKKIRPKKPTQKERSQIIKAKLSKIRKADQQDINRVKRWNSRSFNKKRELSGTTEPVFKTTAAIKPLTVRPQPGIRGDELMARLRNRLAKIRKADGGIAPNYNNPSQVHKPSKIRKKKSKTAAKSKTGYMGDSFVTIPWQDIEADVSFRDMAQFHRKRIWSESQGTFPQIWNLGKLTGEGQSGGRAVFDAAKDAENRFAEELGPEKYQTEMQRQIDHLNKEYGPDPDNDPESLVNIQEAYGNEVANKDELKKYQERHEKMGRQRKALRSAVNKGVNRVNVKKKGRITSNPVVRPKTHPKNKAYLKRRQKANYTQNRDTINPQEEDPTKIVQNATTIGRDPTYIGKTRKRIARIRKAGEQIDPRVKKRKTVRPDSPVQKVSQMKDRIAEMKTAKDHSHSIVFRKHEGIYYRRASLTKQEGKYAKYWLLNAKQTNGNGWGVSRTSIAKNIHKFIVLPNLRCCHLLHPDCSGILLGCRMVVTSYLQTYCLSQ